MCSQLLGEHAWRKYLAQILGANTWRKYLAKILAENTCRNTNATKPPHESGSRERMTKEINAC
jgi:hypothetical protein